MYCPTPLYAPPPLQLMYTFSWLNVLSLNTHTHIHDACCQKEGWKEEGRKSSPGSTYSLASGHRPFPEVRKVKLGSKQMYQHLTPIEPQSLLTE